MLTIQISGTELYDEVRNEFIEVKPQTIVLEHSLVSISKWESKFHKPYLNQKKFTEEETEYYLKCMTLTQNVDPNLYKALSFDNARDIKEYMDNVMTATTFKEEKSKGKDPIITAELVYYWMICYNIPFECQKWHIRKLLALIKVCQLKNSPQQKMSKQEIYARNRSLNEARRKKFNTKG